MKKILILILCFTLTLTIPSCKKTSPYEGKISQLRQEVYFAENDLFKLVCYPEIRENPIVNDGVCGNIENILIFRLTFKNHDQNDLTYDVNFDIGSKSYNGKFEYKTISNLLSCTVNVDSIDLTTLQVTVNNQNQTYSLKMTPQKNKDTITPEKAISNLKKTDEQAKLFLDSDTYEIKIRLIDNEGYDYWYIGFANEEKSVSYLIDGKTGETVAKKEGV